MDAKTIDSALGSLHLGKPPLAPTAAGTRHPPVERDSARVNVGSLDHPRPPSTVVTPRKDHKEELKDDSAAKKPPVIVPSSSRSTPRNNANANASADTGAPPPSANGTGSSSNNNISAKVMNGNDGNANGRYDRGFSLLFFFVL
jgi:type IV secretory pathway VirB10-like protein